MALTFRQRMGGEIDVTNAIGLGVLHLTALLFFIPYFSWSGVWIAIGLWIVSGWFGVCLCYHRLLTHDSFQTTRWLKYMLTIFGALALQGGPLKWAGTHRLHHMHPDEDEDPHSPLHGFTWAHALWVIIKDPHGRDPLEQVKRLREDKFMVFMNNYAWLPQVVLTVILFGLGCWYENVHMGISWVIWGVSVRTVATYNFTWFVNSAAHTWGYRNFETKDRSQNLWWVALVSFGEGWHNNHHGQPRSAAHGMRWFEFDLTYRLIQTLEFFGLAWKVVKPDLTKMTSAKQGVREIVVVHA